MQVCFARIESTTVPTSRKHDDMHVRMGFIIVCGKYVLSLLAELLARERSGGILDVSPISSRRHRHHDVECFSTCTCFLDASSGHLPHLGKVLHLGPPRNQITVLIL
ncbi:hypothetical protein GQ57_37535 [Burkholderia sp. MSh2]|nr:hypothetical protein GQ57_37535 [Burkholderia sp. MSh2]